jgi:hypothetical protein
LKSRKKHLELELLDDDKLELDDDEELLLLLDDLDDIRLFVDFRGPPEVSKVPPKVFVM